jgi:hypothetical protein
MAPTPCRRDQPDRPPGRRLHRHPRGSHPLQCLARRLLPCPSLGLACRNPNQFGTATWLIRCSRMARETSRRDGRVSAPIRGGNGL